MDAFDNFPTGYEQARSLGCFRAVCTRILDGDTYEFTLDLGLSARLGRVQVRLIGFDTAEIFHPRNDAELQHGLEAKKFVTDLFYGRPCLIRTYRTKTGTDQKTLDRYLADVYYMSADGQWKDIKVPMHDAALEKRASY